ncbi:glycosyltransferase family 2 protein [Empedobacter falsenii]|uniref:glycosyltransferase family 2 protein n=1 Tax=Empedobacter TaxID=59734 RepID=UPI0025784A45|nr:MULTISPECIES: glycosyltransferase family 2 protein [Empedobacter]MDM1063530.1 glycosyltransferase family 2 protein [Empedobacter falsenii]
MKKNTISIVLATYNGSDYIKNQLLSVVKQTYPINEIIIIDDKSTDNTVNIILEFTLKYPNIKFIQNDINIGAVGAFQKGLSFTNSDYIALCDQDDIWELDKIEKQMKIFEEKQINNNIPVLSFHDLQVVDINGKTISKSFLKMLKINNSFFCFEKILFSNFVTGCTCVINNSMKKAFLKTNIKNIMMHDHWFALIAFSFGKVFFLDESLIKYRSHPNSVTKKNESTIFSRIKKIGIEFFSKKNNYLLDNIRQAEEFKLLFFSELSLEDRKILNKMIGLKDKFLIIRFIRPFFRIKSILKKVDI